MRRVLGSPFCSGQADAARVGTGGVVSGGVGPDGVGLWKEQDRFWAELAEGVDKERKRGAVLWLGILMRGLGEVAVGMRP